MPYSCGQRICCRALVKIAEWKQNCLRHSFCSYAVALKGFEWISDQADHSIAILKRDYREVVTKADAEAYFDIAVSLLRRVGRKWSGACRCWCPDTFLSAPFPNHIVLNTGVEGGDVESGVDS